MEGNVRFELLETSCHVDLPFCIMNISQEEADRALALLLASQDYEDDYIAYFENEGRLKKKVKKKKDDTEYRPRKRKASRKSSSGIMDMCRMLVWGHDFPRLTL